MKTIYRIFTEKQPSGDYFSKREVEDNEVVKYPETQVPIPEDLKGKLINFNWRQEKWYDYTDEGNRNQIELLRGEIETQGQLINGQNEALGLANDTIDKQVKKITAQDKTIKELKTQVEDLTDVTGGLSEAIIESQF